MHPTYWLILGILLLIGELFTMDFSLAAFGLACLLAGATAWGGLSIYWQLIVFAVSILLMLVALRPFILKTLNKNAKEFKSNIDAVMGKTVMVLSVNEQDATKGVGKIDADDWTLKANEPLVKGDIVKVTKIDGTLLIVVKEIK